MGSSSYSPLIQISNPTKSSRNIWPNSFRLRSLQLNMQQMNWCCVEVLFPISWPVLQPLKVPHQPVEVDGGPTRTKPPHPSLDPDIFVSSLRSLLANIIITIIILYRPPSCDSHCQPDPNICADQYHFSSTLNAPIFRHIEKYVPTLNF